MRGMVAAGHPETVAAAAAVLDAGGNAIDAALAGLCAACVVEPVLASLGGGGFLIARPATGAQAGRSVVYDFFVQTPKRRRPAGDIDFRAVLADFGPAQQEFHVGMGAIATPGVVKGLFVAHRDLGRMPMRRIVEPAIALARNGVPVNAVQGYVLRVVDAIIDAGPGTRAMFASREDPSKRIGENDLLYLPELADALEILAIEGDDLFYRGEMATRLVEDCADGGGLLGAEDLRDYAVERRQPLALDAFGARIELNPPPAAGGLLVAFGLALWQALGRIEGGFGRAAHLRRLVAVMQATARARTEQQLSGAMTAQAAAQWLHPQWIERYRNEVSLLPQVSRGTTQISVVDAAGAAAGITVSNGEGSAYVLPGTGIVLNNMLGETDLQQGIDQWPCDARMSSMMTPTLVFDGKGGVTSLGSGGSNRIRTAMLQVLLNLLAFDMPLAEAVAAPRLHVDSGILSLEPGFTDVDTVLRPADFEAVDAWPVKNMFFGGVHAVRRNGAGAFDGAGDERRGGCACKG